MDRGTIIKGRTMYSITIGLGGLLILIPRTNYNRMHSRTRTTFSMTGRPQGGLAIGYCAKSTMLYFGPKILTITPGIATFLILLQL
jgi:hypothetical protein